MCLSIDVRWVEGSEAQLAEFRERIPSFFQPIEQIFGDTRLRVNVLCRVIENCWEWSDGIGDEYDKSMGLLGGTPGAPRLIMNLVDSSRPPVTLQKCLNELTSFAFDPQRLRMQL